VATEQDAAQAIFTDLREFAKRFSRPENPLRSGLCSNVIRSMRLIVGQQNARINPAEAAQWLGKDFNREEK
jgi:hypothetical protein